MRSFRGLLVDGVSSRQLCRGVVMVLGVLGVVILGLIVVVACLNDGFSAFLYCLGAVAHGSTSPHSILPLSHLHLTQSGTGASAPR